MRKFVAFILVFGFTAAPLYVWANQDHKVTICHATSSTSNPWVRIVVDEHATAGHFDNNGTPLAGHEGDKLLQGDVACPVVTPPTPPTTPPSDTTTSQVTNKVETPETVVGK